MTTIAKLRNNYESALDHFRYVKEKGEFGKEFDEAFNEYCDAQNAYNRYLNNHPEKADDIFDCEEM